MTPGLYNQSHNIITLSEKRKSSIKSLLFKWELITISVPLIITIKVAVEQLILLFKR